MAASPAIFGLNSRWLLIFQRWPIFGSRRYASFTEPSAVVIVRKLPGGGSMKFFARKLIALFSLIGIFWLGPASATLLVDPFIVYIIPNAAGSASVVQLTNVADVALPFDVTVMKR